MSALDYFQKSWHFRMVIPSAVLSVPVDFLWVNRTQEFLSKHNLRTGYLYLAIFREAARGRWSQIWFRIPTFTTTILRTLDQSLKNWELQIMFESSKLFCVTSECYLSFKFLTAVTMVICTSFSINTCNLHSIMYSGKNKIFWKIYYNRFFVIFLSQKFFFLKNFWNIFINFNLARCQ